MSIPINLAVEDSLSESVLRRLLEFAGRGFSVGYVYGRTGNGYLKKTINGWNSAAKGTPLLLLTDLDREECPPSLISDWVGDRKHHNLLFRVAVREVEAWLIADPNLAQYLKIPERLIPADPEMLSDPKGEIVRLAKGSRSREIRRSIVPRSGTTAKQGPAYNSCLERFVRGSWDIGRADRHL